MARQTIVTEELVDDLDGSAGERTIRFTWDGTSYEIELSRRNAQAFEKAMKPYIEAARKAPASRGRQGTRRSAARDLGAVREWALENGFEVSARGRIAASVVDAYEAANG